MHIIALIVVLIIMRILMMIGVRSTELAERERRDKETLEEMRKEEKARIYSQIYTRSVE